MKKLLFILLSYVATYSYASCPGQYDPQSGLCRFQGHDGRLVIYNSGVPISANSSNTSSTKINIIKLSDNWGAISGSSVQPYLDSADNMGSRSEARKYALERCEKATGSSCKILLTYKNGCATVADGLISNVKKNIHQAFAASGDTPEQAEKAALKACERGSGKNCRIVMPTECSLAKRI